MEQPLRRNELNPNEPFEGDSGALGKHKEVPHVAGHILLHETPHGGEIALGAQKVDENGAQPHHVERSAWHTINLDAQGNVMNQEYGQAFQREQIIETGQAPSLVGKMNPGAIAMQQQLPTITSAPVSSSGQVAEPIRTNKVPVNPLYATAAQKQHEPDQAVPPTAVPTVPTEPFPAQRTAVQQPTQPFMPVSQQAVAPTLQPQQSTAHVPTPAVPYASPEHQQISAIPMGALQPSSFQQAQPLQPTGTLTGAVNPSFVQPSMPHAPEPMLPAGNPIHVDPQHLLPSAKHRLRRILTSPWLWLAIGVLMIIYFAPSLFGA